MPAWTDEEERTLTGNYESKSYGEIAELIGKNMEAVKRKAQTMGLVKRDSPTDWTEEQITFIQNNYDKMLYKEIAEKLGTTEKRVFLQAKRMGLSKDRVTLKVGDKPYNARLTVIGTPFIKGKPGQTKNYVECRCDCGKMTCVKVCDLVNGRTKSCGCLQKEAASVRLKKTKTTHGMSYNPLYRSWVEMRARAKEANVTFSSDWDKFEAFNSWAISNGYEEGKTRIYRINILQEYGPNNCFVRRTKNGEG